MPYDSTTPESGRKIDLLLELADVIERLEPRHQVYDQRTWGTRIGDCGTAACAVGWASLKMGHKLNLRLDWCRYRESPIDGLAWPVDATTGEDVDYTEIGERFGLTPIQTNALFGGTDMALVRRFYGTSVPTAATAAARIREFAITGRLARTRQPAFSE